MLEMVKIKELRTHVNMTSDWTKGKGKYMTRICIASNHQELYFASDSLFINTIYDKRIYTDIKATYKRGIIIGILGDSEFLTFNGNVRVKEILNVCLKQYNSIDVLIEDIINSLSSFFQNSLVFMNTQLIILWVENNQFYSFPLQVNNNGLVFPKGKFSYKNLNNYQLNNNYIELGEGVNDYIETNLWSTKLIKNLVINNTQKAIDDSDLSTVGGEVKCIRMDIKGYIEVIT